LSTNRVYAGDLNDSVWSGDTGCVGPTTAAAGGSLAGVVSANVWSRPWSGFGVPFEPLQKQRNVEHGISVFWIGIERALLAIDGLGKPAAFVEQIR
jgi:hypothetical protein